MYIYLSDPANIYRVKPTLVMNFINQIGEEMRWIYP